MFFSNYTASCLLINIHSGGWNKCPLRRRTKYAYKPPAIYTAAVLIATGHWNCDGFEKMIVDAYDSSSNRFWKAASVVEKCPRCESSTSYFKSVYLTLDREL